MTTKSQVIDPSTIDVSRLNSVEFAQKLKLPTIQAVYLALDSENTVLYIGASKNIRARLSGQSHLKFEQLKKLNCYRIAYIPFADKESLLQAETALIKFFRPRLNDRKLNPNSVNQEGLAKVLAEDSVKGIQRVNFPLRVDPDVLQWFGDRATKVGRDRCVLARIALNEYIERHRTGSERSNDGRLPSG
jgi:predicted GIY-YIG superfamily endonuclease